MHGRRPPMRYIFLVLVISGLAAARWTSESETDPITDNKIVVLRTEAVSGRNDLGQHPVLVIRYEEPGTVEITEGLTASISIVVYWGDYVGRDGLSCITRIDEEEPVTYRLSRSTGNDATFFHASRSYDLERLFVQLLDGSEFVVRFTPYASDPITATFSLMGLTAAARREGIDLEAYRVFVEGLDAMEEDSLAVGDEVIYAGLRHEVIAVLREGGRVQLRVMEGKAKDLGQAEYWVSEHECRRADPED